MRSNKILLLSLTVLAADEALLARAVRAIRAALLAAGMAPERAADVVSRILAGSAGIELSASFPLFYAPDGISFVSLLFRHRDASRPRFFERTAAECDEVWEQLHRARVSAGEALSISEEEWEAAWRADSNRRFTWSGGAPRRDLTAAVAS